MTAVTTVRHTWWGIAQGRGRPATPAVTPAESLASVGRVRIENLETVILARPYWLGRWFGQIGGQI